MLLQLCLLFSKYSTMMADILRMWYVHDILPTITMISQYSRFQILIRYITISVQDFWVCGCFFHSVWSFIAPAPQLSLIPGERWFFLLQTHLSTVWQSLALSSASGDWLISFPHRGYRSRMHSLLSVFSTTNPYTPLDMTWLGCRWYQLSYTLAASHRCWTAACMLGASGLRGSADRFMYQSQTVDSHFYFESSNLSTLSVR